MILRGQLSNALKAERSTLGCGLEQRLIMQCICPHSTVFKIQTFCQQHRHDSEADTHLVPSAPSSFVTLSGEMLEYAEVDLTSLQSLFV